MSTALAPSLQPPADIKLTDFAPSARRAAFLDQRMRHDLANSLQHILDCSAGQLAVSHEALQHFITQLQHHPVSPLAFSFYAEAVIAIDEDNLDEASRLLTELATFPPVTPGTAITPLADPRQDARSARVVRFIDTDPNFSFEVYPPAPEAADRCKRSIDAALALMDAGDPDQSAETRALLRQIYLAAGSSDPKALTFDGASSFMLWGAIVLNVSRTDCPLAMAQMLVHEGTHNLLFGLCADETLVENEDDELYDSPLRKDPRPMDGIYHATIVSARMYRVVKKLLISGTLSPELAEKAQKEIAENARLFQGGLATVHEHARLTPLGKAILESTEKEVLNLG